MAIDLSLIQPVVDAILKLVKVGSNARLKANANKKVRQAILKILEAKEGENQVELALRGAEAAELLTHEALLLETMQNRIRSAKKKKAKKSPAQKRAEAMAKKIVMRAKKAAKKISARATKNARRAKAKAAREIKVMKAKVVPARKKAAKRKK